MIKRFAVLAVIAFSLISCVSTETVNSNRYKKHEVKPVSFGTGNNQLSYNKLFFRSAFSPNYTQQFMYDKFGKWDKIIWQEGSKIPILVWEDRYLANINVQSYTVFADGSQTQGEQYASVIVVDSQNRDCLANNALEKDSFVEFFVTGIQNLSKDSNFYSAYRAALRENGR